jgi:citrate lyase subunit beta / citryl-CoA lyase
MTVVNSALARIYTARAFLFVPGDRPDRFDKARDSDADIVVIDGQMVDKPVIELARSLLAAAQS